MLDKEIIEKHFKLKGYLHFDRRVKFEKVESYVTNPQKIMLHSFLPFIHYIVLSEKFIRKSNIKIESFLIKEKSREIMYAGHLDGYIYKYYSMLLNKDYNQWVKRNKVDDCSLAYRDNKPEQSNIDFAAEVINKIVCWKNAYILVGDFTNFFDRLNHRVLKSNLVEILDNSKLIDDTKLNKDWYNIFRSVTKFGYYDKQTINELCGVDQELWKNKQRRYFNTISDLRNFQKEYKTKRNTNPFGIPQGTAISGVLANVYATNFDLELKKISDKYKGIYRRYSDDFILVVPKQQKDNRKISIHDFDEIEKKVIGIAKDNEIILQESKSGKYEYENCEIVNLETGKYSRVDYLGFIFDGKTVRMRGKSPYKFYRTAYDLIKKAKRVKGEKN